MRREHASDAQLEDSPIALTLQIVSVRWRHAVSVTAADSFKLLSANDGKVAVGVWGAERR